VVGCTALSISQMSLEGVKSVTIDGLTGRVWVDMEVPVVNGANAPEVKRVAEWAALKMLSWLSTPVFDDDFPHLPQVVRAAEWWGDDEVLDAVLQDLAALPAGAQVILDLTPPAWFLPHTDHHLHNAFGSVAAGPAVWPSLWARVGKGLPDMPCVKLHTISEMVVSLAKMGVSAVPHLPPAGPMDYIVFTALAA
jgi:hypothetical protein